MKPRKTDPTGSAWHAPSASSPRTISDQPNLDETAQEPVGPVAVPFPAPVHALCRRQPQILHRPSDAGSRQAAELVQSASVLDAALRSRPVGPVAAARPLPEDRGDDAGRLCAGRRRYRDRYRLPRLRLRPRAGDDDGQRACAAWPSATRARTTAVLADMRARWPKAHLPRKRRRAPAAIAAQIFEQAGGRRARPASLIGTKWQIKVWEALLAVPSGKVTTYRGVAAEIGNAKASRAVGTAVGRNPISWLIPCHRVLGSDGALARLSLGRRRASARCWRWKRRDQLSSQAEHVGHRGRRPGGFLALAPFRGGERARGKDRAVLGAVREHDALVRTGEDHLDARTRPLPPRSLAHPIGGGT